MVDTLIKCQADLHTPSISGLAYNAGGSTYNRAGGDIGSLRRGSGSPRPSVAAQIVGSDICDLGSDNDDGEAWDCRCGYTGKGQVHTGEL